MSEASFSDFLEANSTLKEELFDEEDSVSSVVILVGFLAGMLTLSAIGISCSYLCYKRSRDAAKQRMTLLPTRNDLVGGGGGFSNNNGRRCVPNFYCQSPKEERDEARQHLLRPQEPHSPISRSCLHIPRQINNSR